MTAPEISRVDISVRTEAFGVDKDKLAALSSTASVPTDTLTEEAKEILVDGSVLALLQIMRAQIQAVIANEEPGVITVRDDTAHLNEDAVSAVDVSVWTEPSKNPQGKKPGVHMYGATRLIDNPEIGASYEVTVQRTHSSLSDNN